MPFYKFKKNDKFVNVVKTYPKNEFMIWSGSVFYNNQTSSAPHHVSGGYINLFEMNQATSSVEIYRWKNRDIGDANVYIGGTSYDFFHTYDQGEEIKNTYPLTASISRILYNYYYDDYNIPATNTALLAGWGYKEGVPKAKLPNGTYVQQALSGAQHGLNNDLEYYPMFNNGFSSWKAGFFAGNSTNQLTNGIGRRRRHLEALKNTINYYSYMSPHFNYVSDQRVEGKKNLGKIRLNMVSVPSIFYGSGIKKGSVSLKYFITGTLIAELADIKRNGELIQVGPTGSAFSGTVAGIALYNEGIFLLTASHDLTKTTTLSPGVNTKFGPTRTYNYVSPTSAAFPSWLHWGASMRESTIYGYDGNAKSRATWTSNKIHCPTSSFSLEFQGTNHVSTITSFAHAPKGKLNHSNNLTYIDYSSNITGSILGPDVSKKIYREHDEVQIKNTVKSKFKNYEEKDFKKQTFISKIALYDENKNLVGVAKLANPVKKKEDRDITFKIKLDI